jgi:hypothetical protein
MKTLSLMKQNPPRSIQNWPQHAGGTTTPTKHGYTFRENEIDYHISPVANKYGRMLGYQVTRFGAPPSYAWQWLNPHNLAWLSQPPPMYFRSPQQAASAIKQTQSASVMKDNPNVDLVKGYTRSRRRIELKNQASRPVVTMKTNPIRQRRGFPSAALFHKAAKLFKYAEKISGNYAYISPQVKDRLKTLFYISSALQTKGDTITLFEDNAVKLQMKPEYSGNRYVLKYTRTGDIFPLVNSMYSALVHAYVASRS